MSIPKNSSEDEGQDKMAFTAKLYHRAAAHIETEQKEEKSAPQENSAQNVTEEVTGIILYRSAKRAPDRLTSHLPPINFGAVVPNAVYRSSFPLPENFSFIKSLRLKTILTLVPRPFPDSYVQFMEENGIRQIVVPIPANKEVVCMDAQTMIKALGVVLDKKSYPLLIHCNKGKHRTGCVVSCLRKTQGEALASCISEYHTYAGTKARPLDVEFITGFDERALLWLARENSIVAEDGPPLDSPLLSPLKMPSRTRG